MSIFSFIPLGIGILKEIFKVQSDKKLEVSDVLNVVDNVLTHTDLSNFKIDIKPMEQFSYRDITISVPSNIYPFIGTLVVLFNKIKPELEKGELPINDLVETLTSIIKELKLENTVIINLKEI